MASPTEPISHFLHSATSNLLSIFTPKTTSSPSSSSSLTTTKICVPLVLPIPMHSLHFDSSDSISNSNSKSSAVNAVQSADSGTSSTFPSTVRISSLNSNGRAAGGPAFVGQVFSMCDLSGTGLMAVSTHFDIPFISKREMAEEHEDETLRFQVSGEWVFKFQGNGFLTVFKLDFGEEHEDEDDTGCWGKNTIWDC
ncbi:hypothetical protein CFP56_021317 [Quercus suber]|uniref:Uncharacterized protein n=1 Tax=Quercus suber TaxID=58331 RepID=A0AAW0KHQ2_QUESU